MRRTRFRLAIAGVAMAGAAVLPATAAMATTTDHAAGAQQPGGSQPCTVTITPTENGVTVKTAPRDIAPVVGQTHKGQKFQAYCGKVKGQKYTACGHSSDLWRHLKFQGRWRYSVATCYKAL